MDAPKKIEFCMSSVSTLRRRRKIVTQWKIKNLRKFLIVYLFLDPKIISYFKKNRMEIGADLKLIVPFFLVEG